MVIFKQNLAEIGEGVEISFTTLQQSLHPFRCFSTARCYRYTQALLQLQAISSKLKHIHHNLGDDLWVSVCVCVKERKKERKRERERVNMQGDEYSKGNERRRRCRAAFSKKRRSFLF